MPQLADPAEMRSRPTSVTLGELAIAAGLAGESVTMTSDFPASTLCPIWKYYTQSLGVGNVLHARATKDMKNFGSRLSNLRAVFVHSPRMYEDVAWTIQMEAASEMSPRPAVFCAFQHDDPDTDPGLTLPLATEEHEIAAVDLWASNGHERHVLDVQLPSSIECDTLLETAFDPSAAEHGGIGPRERRIAGALVEGAAILRSAAGQADGDIQTTLDDYGFVRGLLCSAVVRRNRELCEPLALDMIRRANVYLSVKLGSDRGNPFRVECEGGYRSARGSSLKRDAITRRELTDLGNVHSRMVVTLIDYLQNRDDGHARYLQLGRAGEPLPKRNWKRQTARELARRLKGWSVKQVRTHFDRLQQRGLVTATRERANGPLRYEMPEEFENVASPYSMLPTARSLARDHATT
jgi:hypothetical protein